MTLHDALKQLTAHVRRTKGTKEAAGFYIDHIQPIQEYFGGHEAVKDIELDEDEKTYTKGEIINAFSAGEVSMIDAEHVVNILERNKTT